MTNPMRTEYGRAQLNESDLLTDPIHQLRHWIQEAMASDVPEVNAMTLATSTPDGRPSARIVLFKDVNEHGITFHSCYDSRKGRELALNPLAALVIFWPALERQVRVEGRVERLSTSESDAYFQTRPLGSQLGAWASRQSEVLDGREALESQYAAVRDEFHNRDIPRPPNWGGYRLIPEVFEFWQGRQSRLHDRFRYRLEADGVWIIERLSP